MTGFGNPDWARTHQSHPAATSTALAVLAVLRGGATCVGKTVLDEMAYRLVLKKINNLITIYLHFFGGDEGAWGERNLC